MAGAPHCWGFHNVRPGPNREAGIGPGGRSRLRSQAHVSRKANTGRVSVAWPEGHCCRGRSGSETWRVRW